MNCPDVIDCADEFRLAGTPWFLDARQPRSHCVVSHAHSDHIGRHALTLATPETCDLLAHRLDAAESDLPLSGHPPAPPGQVLPLAYHALHTVGDTQIQLLPAGHVLGSAMVLARTPRGSLLYTGDFRLRDDALTVPPCQLPPPGQVDALLMECTYGSPRYRFPPRGQVVAQLCDLVAGALAEGRQPVCFCYSLGKSQEIARVLAHNGFAIAMHDAPANISDIYARHGVAIGPYRRHALGASLAGHVLIAPPHIRNSRLIRAIANPLLIVITGWAVDASAKYRYQVDHALPISDHADFDELLSAVDRISPKKVLLTHGFVDEMVMILRSRGFQAAAAVSSPQGSLFDF